MALNPEDLNVDSFPTADSASSIGTGGGYCCTGCDSGCGFNPTGGGCESGSDQPYCVDQIGIA
jgi:hypothetical protein